MERIICNAGDACVPQTRLRKCWGYVMTDSTRSSVRARALFGTFVLVIGITAIFLLASHSVSAGPKVIQGYVYDVDGQKFGGSKIAYATVTIKDSGGSVRQTLTDVDGTDPNGLYRVTLDGSKWSPGDTIEVYATYNSVPSPTNTTTCDEDPTSQNVDVHFPTAIPQFGSTIGLVLVSVFVGSVAVAALCCRRQ